ncbi:MAG: type II toxin-antitoxin system RelE/ParE family toxin [Planctomycetes bacterium]|nr:type II toxin-antitoxin system RelE/ParE family toxin [Planctomycetota bacterium]
MAFQIVWSEAACRDLQEIVQYIAIEDHEAACRLAERIVARIEIASEFPLSIRLVPEKGDESIREAILSPYRIVYVVEQTRKAIQVLRIWHAARGVPDIG